MGDTVRSVISRFEAERMPARQSMVRVYCSFLNNYALPRWADTRIHDFQPRSVELGLRELPLSPKSKTHVRSIIHGLEEFAMWGGMLDTIRNLTSSVKDTADIRTTMNIYADVVMDEMTTADVKVSQLAFQGNRAQWKLIY